MDEALKIAKEKFKALHFENIPAICGVSLLNGKIKIKYLTRWYFVPPDATEITYLEAEKQVPQREKIIILHYLNSGKGAPLTDKLIDFREIPSGNMYYSSFEARIYQPFVVFFGKNPSLFIKASKALEGERIDLGDIAFKFMVLPKIPVNFILHKGDEEFPPACKVLFDASVRDYLPTEDIAIICEDTVRELTQKVR